MRGTRNKKKMVESKLTKCRGVGWSFFLDVVGLVLKTHFVVLSFLKNHCLAP